LRIKLLKNPSGIFLPHPVGLFSFLLSVNYRMVTMRKNMGREWSSLTTEELNDVDAVMIPASRWSRRVSDTRRAVMRQIADHTARCRRFSINTRKQQL